VSLVGESGSGKSTIARIILGLQRASSGQVTYYGKDIYSLTGDEFNRYRKDVQAVFQDPYGIFNPFYRVDRVFWTAIKQFKLAKSREQGQALIEELIPLEDGEIYTLSEEGKVSVIKPGAGDDTATFIECKETDLSGLISTAGTAFADLLEGVAIEVPRYYMAAPSIFSPTKAYWHLDVPAGVSLGCNADRAHRAGITGKGIKVAMVDSGHFAHPFFAARGYRVAPVVLAPGATVGTAPPPLPCADHHSRPTPPPLQSAPPAPPSRPRWRLCGRPGCPQSLVRSRGIRPCPTPGSPPTGSFGCRTAPSSRRPRPSALPAPARGVCVPAPAGDHRVGQRARRIADGDADERCFARLAGAPDRRRDPGRLGA